MDVLFFPDNKLGAEITPFFNGHVAAISATTDRIIDNKYELAEIALFKNNQQGTVYLNPFGVSNNENADYGNLIRKIKKTGRIGFGLYYRTDYWINPLTGNQEVIPDYYSTKWSANGATYFDVTIGAAKSVKTPNHGQQMYDISSGRWGYDFNNGVAGSNGVKEAKLHTTMQLDYFKDLAQLTLSSGSFSNGATGGALLQIPYLLGMRNSGCSYSGNGDTSYFFNREQGISKPSTTRTWDMQRAGHFGTQNQSLKYTQLQVKRAINTEGWFTDFMHWHSLYNFDDTAFFEKYFKTIDDTIGESDVWRADVGSVNEYYFLKSAINKIGSFEHKGDVYIFVRFNDNFTGTNTNGIDNSVNAKLINTPLSIKIDLSGTLLAGKSIGGDRVQSVRNLGGDKWVVNVRPKRFGDGYFTFKITEEDAHIYNPARPVITKNETGFTSNLPAKFVVWEKSSNPKELLRTSSYSENVRFSLESGKSYFIGAITQSNQSSLVEVSK